MIRRAAADLVVAKPKERRNETKEAQQWLQKKIIKAYMTA